MKIRGMWQLRTRVCDTCAQECVALAHRRAWHSHTRVRWRDCYVLVSKSQMKLKSSRPQRRTDESDGSLVGMLQ